MSKISDDGPVDELGYVAPAAQGEGEEAAEWFDEGADQYEAVGEREFSRRYRLAAAALRQQPVVGEEYKRGWADAMAQNHTPEAALQQESKS